MRTVKLVTAVVAVLLAGAPLASAAFQPHDLSVDGGEESWHAERSFAVRWDNPPGVAAVHYRLLSSSGQVVLGETTIGWPATSIQHLFVPAIADIYTAEVRLEDMDGNEGPAGSVKLRFDDGAPGQVSPQSATGWIGRTAFPYTLHLGLPAGPEPISGIRGYAVAIATAPGIAPCAGKYTCSEAETDLRAGADALTIVALPEGTSYLGAVAVSGSGMRSSVAAETILKVDKTDPVTRLTGLAEGWSNQPLTLRAEATDTASGMAAAGANGPFTAIRIDGGSPVVASGATVSAPVIGSGVHTIAYYARDAAGNVADGGIANGWPHNAPATALVRIDRDAPHLSFAGAQDPGDPERIEAHAADALSGLDRSRASIAVRRAGTAERFERLPTELAAGTLRARWDSEAYPPGEYEFRAAVYDLAGNSNSTASRANGSPMRLRNPLKVATTLSASLGRRAVPYGRGMSFSGELIAGRRTGLGGMPVQVIERFEVGASPAQRVSTVRTGAGGEFSVRLRPGPSREIIAVAAPTATLRGARSKPARLTVRSGMRMAVSSPVAKVGGRPIVFRGKVGAEGATVPADGKIVQLQFRLPGQPWSGFRSLRTDAQGRFRYAYRFADDDSRGARFQFRAFTPAQANWPYKQASSRPVAVTGT